MRRTPAYAHITSLHHIDFVRIPHLPETISMTGLRGAIRRRSDENSARWWRGSGCRDGKHQKARSGERRRTPQDPDSFGQSSGQGRFGASSRGAAPTALHGSRSGDHRLCTQAGDRALFTRSSCVLSPGTGRRMPQCRWRATTAARRAPARLDLVLPSSTSYPLSRRFVSGRISASVHRRLFIVSPVYSSVAPLSIRPMSRCCYHFCPHPVSRPIRTVL
ncbi:hypothetical protein BD309DRAFT_514914 [Dichomitus squalens]|nr:hypothetical protein BD309DRAFT_514914 [Dichomitus squalens]